jgi:hypothetical protein
MVKLKLSGDEILVATTISYPLELRERARDQGINLSATFREALTQKVENAERAGDAVPTTPRHAVQSCHTIETRRTEDG